MVLIRINLLKSGSTEDIERHSLALILTATLNQCTKVRPNVFSQSQGDRGFDD